MNKSSLRFITVISFILLTLALSLRPALGEEKIFPQSDFFLYLGIRKTMPDPPSGQRIERMLFSAMYIDIKGGKISANKTISVDYTKGIQDFKGTASINMTGDYSKDDGQLSGTFIISQDIISVWHGSDFSTTDNWISQTSGNFFGQVVDDKTVIRFKGKTNESGRNQMADQSYKNFSETVDYLVSTAWRLSVYKAETPPVISEADQEFLDEKGNTIDSGARFSGMEGKVEIHFPGTPEDEWTAVEMEMVIPVGTRIRTKEESTVTLGFSDMSTFILKPETEIILSKPPGKESKLGLVAGNIWVNIKKMVKDGSMEIDTFQAVAGIKGTTLVASADKEKATFKLIEGQLSVKALNSNESVNLIGGQSAAVDKAGAIVKENFDFIAEQDSWDNALQIDLDALEKLLPSESATAPADGSSAPEPQDKIQTWIFYVAIFGTAILIGTVLALIYRKKRQ